jgi:putative ABC transport system ATP-binding protein
MRAGLVSAHDISKAYGPSTGRVQALRGVSLQVHAGSFTAVIGPSGSGKTTLLHCLSGLAVPDEGRVELAGTDLSALDDDERAAVRRNTMAFVFQRENSLPALTVVENVAVPLLMRGLPRAQVDERVSKALEDVGLGDRARAFPSELSGGELQRVAVARAICAAPKLLWADEPTGALDSTAAKEIVRLLRLLVSENSAVVVVTHSGEVAEHADQVLELRDGRRVR